LAIITYCTEALHYKLKYSAQPLTHTLLLFAVGEMFVWTKCDGANAEDSI